MTFKEELRLIWIFYLIFFSFVARHFFGGAFYLLEHVAACSLSVLPVILQHSSWHFG
jgi:hypothetical protein